MLVLSRKCGEKIVIGDNITITVLTTDSGRIRIGIEAPDDVTILRAELIHGHPSAPAAPREFAAAGK